MATLRGGPPANAADLFAFVLDHLTGIKRDLRNAATDRYKAFWNEGSIAEVTIPKVEDSGRDRLVDMMNERMERQGVVVDPEGHLTDDNRCDVRVAQREQTLPIEVKRQHHPRVWTALRGQLDPKYFSDVRARGSGIYIVLWYGVTVQQPPLPPGGGLRLVTRRRRKLCERVDRRRRQGAPPRRRPRRLASEQAIEHHASRGALIGPEVRMSD